MHCAIRHTLLLDLHEARIIGIVVRASLTSTLMRILMMISGTAFAAIVSILPRMIRATVGSLVRVVARIIARAVPEAVTRPIMPLFVLVVRCGWRGKSRIWTSGIASHGGICRWDRGAGDCSNWTA